VEYLGWDGGVIGLKIDTAMHLVIGRAGVVVPPLLVAVGAAIFLHSPLTRLRPLRTGAIVCLGTLVLALSTTDTSSAEHHGGLVGAYARIGVNGLVGPIGVSILVVLGALVGGVLVTGASLGLAMRTSGRHVARAAGAGMRLSEEVGGGAVNVRASGLRIVENFLDLAHFPYVHTDILGTDWFAHAERPVVDVRSEFGLLPRSDKAIAAGSPSFSAAIAASQRRASASVPVTSSRKWRGRRRMICRSRMWSSASRARRARRFTSRSFASASKSRFL